MKKFIISILILIIIISFIAINYFVLKNHIEKIENILLELTIDSQNGYKNAYALIDKLKTYWTSNSAYIKIVTKHDDWEDIYSSISKLEIHLKTKSYNLFLEQLDELKSDIKHLFTSEMFSIENIF